MSKVIDIKDKEFCVIFLQIQQTRNAIFSYANQALLDLYWQIGATITQKLQYSGWGKGVVSELANYIAKQDPTLKGFSDKNLWRMKQFYETYQQDEKLIALSKKLSWTHNTIIFARCKNSEEREFYLKLSFTEKLTKRELERQIDSATFERSKLGNQILSPLVRELHPEIHGVFKDSYILEFLGLPEIHDEKDLQQALVNKMKQFIVELGKDFIFVGQEYRLQVGNQDFYIDLLFFQRNLSALVAFEIKVGRFKPEYLGQLNFYLEALDRDVKKAHENPSIGVLLCRDKDVEVVEYAMSRNLSPTLIAQYQLQLPEKKFLEAKLHEIFVDLKDDTKSETDE